MDSIMIKKMLARWAELMKENKEYLIKLDSVAGDGDLGLTMNDGFTAINESVKSVDETDLGKILYLAGKTLSKAAPSSMGTLISIGLINASKILKGRTELDNLAITEMLECIGEGVKNTGQAKEGEKTFLDSILPAARAARENISLNTPEFTKITATAAEQGFNNTLSMIAKHGRIAFRGEASIGIADPGAAVAMLLVRGINDIYHE
jgi:phosphoenolpyruvate---glycerone phosphotransferase subunit DhaL